MSGDRGKGKTIYVGGFGLEVNETVLYSVFSPFGDIVELQIPLDPSKRDEEKTHRGFGFVEFAEATDAQAAVDNISIVQNADYRTRHLNEINGKVLKVNLSRPIKGQKMLGTNKAVWEDAEWIAQQAKREAGEAEDDD